MTTTADATGRTATGIETTPLVVDYRTDAGIVRALDCGPISVSGGTGVAIMGPSGSGKSTLLGLLAGLALPTQGQVRIGSVVVSDLNDRARTEFRRSMTGIVYQADNLLPHLTAEENVGLPLSICAPGAVDTDAAPALLDRLGLGALAPRFPDQLSGGQRQRVAVARAVVHRPGIVLADEPTGALDPANAMAVIDLLVEVNAAIGATLVVVTHDPVIAVRLERTIHVGRPRSEQANHAR
jgi:putative ABC transport system ATP-binding protein